MSLPNVTFTILNGGIGRNIENQDGISGFVFLNDNVADLTQFSATNNIIAFNTLKDVEKTGITSSSTNFKEEYYQISEFFRMGGNKLYVGIFDTSSTIEDGIEAMHIFSAGTIRLYGAVESIDLAEASINSLNTVMQVFVNSKKPAIAIYGANTGTIEATGLPDLRNLTSPSPWVSCVLGQDTEKYPLTVTTKSLPNVGAVLGAISSTDVATNPMNIGKFNYATGGYMNIPGFMLNDGLTSNVLYKLTDSVIAESLLDDLNAKGYLFWRYTSLAGSYLNNDHTCDLNDSDFYAIHNTRVMQKAIRLADIVLTPMIGSKIVVNSDGTIKKETINSMTNELNVAFRTMSDAVELSDWNVYIDKSQKPLVNNTIDVEISILPIGSSDYINVTIGFKGTL